MTENPDLLLSEALGTPPLSKRKQPRLLHKTRSWWLDDGVWVRSFLAQNSLGETFSLFVAEPPLRLFTRPVIAAHQTNEVGAKEVFGINGNPSLNYGQRLARHGHRVFSINLRWIDGREGKALWDGDGFRQKHPSWSMVGSDLSDYEDLIDLMQNAFGERLPFDWVGHSHGGIDGYFLAAHAPEGTFAHVVANAAYVCFPSDVSPDDYTSFERYFTKGTSAILWRHLDSILALAATKTKLLLNVYRLDQIMPFPLPTVGKPPSSDRLVMKIYDGQHGFPQKAQEISEQFLESDLSPKQNNLWQFFLKKPIHLGIGISFRQARHLKIMLQLWHRRWIESLQKNPRSWSNTFSDFLLRPSLFDERSLFLSSGRWKVFEGNKLPNTKLRVLVLSNMFPHPDQPGLGSFVLEQIAALREAGVDARVLSGRPYWMTQTHNPFRFVVLALRFWKFRQLSMKRSWSLDGVPVQYIPYPILGPFWSHALSYRFAIGDGKWLFGDEEKIDLIHAHTGYLDGTAAHALAKKHGCPYLVTEHTGPFSNLMRNTIVRRTTLRSLRESHRILAVSRAQSRAIEEYLHPQNKEQLTVLPNTINMRHFNVPESWTPNPESPRILFVGYFVPVKNIPLLLDAFRIVLKEKPQAKLTLAGGGETLDAEQKLRDEIQKMGLSGNITVRGFLERGKLAQLMREACDMLVLCSQSETFGCVVVEALASGKPAVVTASGGPEDIILDERFGVICKNNDAQALADALLATAARLPGFDPVALRQFAEERFSGPTIANSLILIYNEILQRQERNTP